MSARDANVFAGAHFDRLGHKRRDPAWLERMLGAPEAAYVPVWQQRNLLGAGTSPDAVLLHHDAIERPQPSQVVLLGEYAGKVCFALDLGDHEGPPPLSARGEFRTLRTVGLLVPEDRAALLAYAQAMVLWHRRQRFCSVCGNATRSEEAGHLRRCENPGCGHGFFPRIEPAIIVLVVHEGEALLGRQSGWPEGVYSTLAGFVEPGESLEDAVRREVAEETGVALGAITYHSSQPWPFPASLMLGFRAQARSRSIQLHDDELEDACWFSRERLEDGYRAGRLRVPPPLSISHRLIASWFDDGQPGRLAALAERYARPA